MTKKFNLAKGVVPLGDSKMPRKVETARTDSGMGPADQVDFSSLFQQVSRPRETAAATDPQRIQKLAALKVQIAHGTYQPDLEKVAESLLGFIAKGK